MQDADATASAADSTDADVAADPIDADAATGRTKIELLLDDRSITDERRRDAALALVRRDAAVGPRRLAAELESEWDARNRDVIAAELHHVHLPKLDEAGVLEYDDEATTARLLDDESTVAVR